MTDTTTPPVDLAALRAAAMKATPGPWSACNQQSGGCKCGGVWSGPVDAPVATANTDELWDDGPSTDECKKADALYIAAANPVAVLALLDENERLLSRVANAETDRDVTAERLAAAEAEMDAILYAARMPADYEFGLPSYINMELYGRLIMLLDRDGRVIRRSEDIEEMLMMRRELAAERAAHAQTATALRHETIVAQLGMGHLCRGADLRWKPYGMAACSCCHRGMYTATLALAPEPDTLAERLARGAMAAAVKICMDESERFMAKAERDGHSQLFIDMGESLDDVDRLFDTDSELTPAEIASLIAYHCAEKIRAHALAERLAHNSGLETQRAAKLHAALSAAREHGGHKRSCARRRRGSECDCGWQALLAEIDAALALLPPGMMAEAGGDGEAAK